MLSLKITSFLVAFLVIVQLSINNINIVLVVLQKSHRTDYLISSNQKNFGYYFLELAHSF